VFWAAHRGRRGYLANIAAPQQLCRVQPVRLASKHERHALGAPGRGFGSGLGTTAAGARERGELADRDVDGRGGARDTAPAREPDHSVHTLDRLVQARAHARLLQHAQAGGLRCSPPLEGCAVGIRACWSRGSQRERHHPRAVARPPRSLGNDTRRAVQLRRAPLVARHRANSRS